MFSLYSFLIFIFIMIMKVYSFKNQINSEKYNKNSQSCHSYMQLPVYPLQAMFFSSFIPPYI